MTAILEGRNSRVLRALVEQVDTETQRDKFPVLRLLKVVVGLGSNYTVNTDKLYCWRLKCKFLPIPEDAVAIYKPFPN